MHDALQKELALYEKRTPKSGEAHKKAQKRIPLGVASNYRAYDPYPIFVTEGQGSNIRDIDGNISDTGSPYTNSGGYVSNTGTFGLAQKVRDPRQLQFGLKFAF